jgi:hypothetical protein
MGSARCPYCGRTVRTVVPRGGDGSLEVYVRHDDTPGHRCQGARYEVRQQ